jgi:integrase/recombinase XerC
MYQAPHTMGACTLEPAMPPQPHTTLALPDPNATDWDHATYAFLAEKERRSGSMRTVQSYARMLQHAFATFGTTPDLVTRPEVFAWAYNPGKSGQRPGPITIAARVACLSSYYRFLIRMGLLAANPCDAIERPKAPSSTPHGLTADQVQQLLAVIPDTKVGLRDRAIILTLVFTGRRRAEVFGLTRGHLAEEDGKVFYRYRGKGGKTGRRELPRPAYDAIMAALVAWGKDLATMTENESLWPSACNPNGLTSGTFYGNLRRYLKSAGLPLSGVHVFRHSAAKLRRDAGESVEAVSSFLDHSSLAVTSVYLKRLEGQEDHSWDKVAVALGM